MRFLILFIALNFFPGYQTLPNIERATNRVHFNQTIVRT